MKINWKKVAQVSAQVGEAVASVTPAGPVVGKVAGALRGNLSNRQRAVAIVEANFGVILQSIDQEDADISAILTAVTAEVEEWLQAVS
tara:strand:+ start:353 stop:616 length:264 start_codon:yes stop_codon:yes gene_type:complete